MHSRLLEIPLFVPRLPFDAERKVKRGHRKVRRSVNRPIIFARQHLEDTRESCDSGALRITDAGIDILRLPRMPRVLVLTFRSFLVLIYCILIRGERGARRA